MIPHFSFFFFPFLSSCARVLHQSERRGECNQRPASKHHPAKASEIQADPQERLVEMPFCLPLFFLPSFLYRRLVSPHFLLLLSFLFFLFLLLISFFFSLCCFALLSFILHSYLLFFFVAFVLFFPLPCFDFFHLLTLLRTVFPSFYLSLYKCCYINLSSLMIFFPSLFLSLLPIYLGDSFTVRHHGLVSSPTKTRDFELLLDIV